MHRTAFFALLVATLARAGESTPMTPDDETAPRPVVTGQPVRCTSFVRHFEPKMMGTGTVIAQELGNYGMQEAGAAQDALVPLVADGYTHLVWQQDVARSADFGNEYTVTVLCLAREK